MKKVFLLVIFIFLTLPLCAQEEITTINIINALKTDYKKDADTGNDSIVLEGAVELSVTKGSTKTVVKANKVTYDRVTKMLYADGDVHVTSTGSSAGDENITASTLILNTSTLEGVFDGGRVVQTQSDAINLPSGSTLVVFSDLFGKSSENTLAFKNASLTFCDDEDPHWKINASRIWLLPGGEFAFLNALLFVGSVPVLYLPAFYYPKDELIFNPVFGYKNREGYFIHTTTYIYGRKPLGSGASASSSSSKDSDDKAADATLDSLYNFMKPNKLKVQKLEGIMLHNLDEDYSGNTSEYLKLMADWYSNLGFMVGLDGNFSPKEVPISKLSFNFELGFSNPIFSYPNNRYMNISPAGQKYWDRSDFMGIKMPFRYKADFQFGISKPLRINLSLPIYSDPYFGYDFGKRSEDLNWISAIKELLEKNEDIDTSSVSSFTWSLTTSYSPTLPNFIKTYISSLSFNTTSSVNISSITANSDKLKEMFSERYKNDSSFNESDLSSLASASPERSFYYPSQVTPVSASASISGTLFKWPMTSSSSPKKDKKNIVVSLNKPEDLMNPKEQEALQEKRAKEAEELSKKQEETCKDEKSSETENNEDDNAESKSEIKTESEETAENKDDEVPVKTLYEEIASLPTLAVSTKNESEVSGLNYSLGYSIAPNISTQFSYSTTGLYTPSDFDWENPRSFMYTFKMPASLNSNLTYGGNFFSLSNKFTYSPVWQDHPYTMEAEYEETSSGSTSRNINGGYTEKEIESLKKTDFAASTQNIVNTNTLSVKPFIYNPLLKDTGVSWNTNLKLYQKKFLADSDIDDPQYDIIKLDWDDKETVTTNDLSFVLATNELDSKLKQSLTFSITMPPLDEKYSGTLSLVFPYVTVNFGAGIYKKTTKKTSTNESGEKDEVEEVEWLKDPLQQSLSVSVPLLGKNITLSESFNYNLQDEEHHPDSFKTSLSWYGFSFAYVMSYVIGYNFEEGSGWVAESEKSFLPYSLSMTYTPTTKTFYKWKNRISVAPGLSTSVVYDMVRSTNSYFLFSPALTFKLNGLLDITFSSTSRNSSIVTYFDDRILGARKNIFTDLLNSFRFDNETLRKASGFKLKSLNIDISHELHDWKFKMAFKVEPKLVTRMNNGKTRKEYIFDPYIAIGVVWSPMEAIKTNVAHKYDSSYSEYEEDGTTKKGTGYYIWELD